MPPVRRRTGVSALASAIALSLSSFLPQAQAALPDCAHVVTAQPILEHQGILEALVFDGRGRLLLSNISAKAVNVLDRPGAQPTVLADGIAMPGGLALGDNNEVYVGSTPNILDPLFPSLGKSSLVRIDLLTGAKQTYLTGLTMANGVVRAQDGSFYASNDLASSLDRVLPDKTVQRTWLAQQSNGLALSADQHTLYVNQTLPAKVLAVDLASGTTRVIVDTPSGEYFAALDGLTIDGAGNLYAAAYLAGKIWKISPHGEVCILAKGFTFPSAVAFGPQGGTSFHANSLYVTTHSGGLFELPGVLPMRRGP